MKAELRFDGRKWRGTRIFKGRTVTKEDMAIEILDEWKTSFLRKVDKMTRISKVRRDITETVFNFLGKNVPN